jgi:hypothetical protein
VDEKYLDLPGKSPRAEYRTPFPGGSNRPQIVTSADARIELSQLPCRLGRVVPDHLLFLAMVRDPLFAVELARTYNASIRLRKFKVRLRDGELRLVV